MVEHLKEVIAGASASRKVVFGSITFAMVGAYLYGKFPHIFNVFGDRYWFIAGCFILGGVLQRTVEGTVKFLFPKSAREITYYEDLQELHRDFQRGLIPPDTYKRIADKLIEKRFLGESTNVSQGQ